MHMLYRASTLDMQNLRERREAKKIVLVVDEFPDFLPVVQCELFVIWLQ